ISTTEAEYVAAASCCGQVLWIQNQLLDYGTSRYWGVLRILMINLRLIPLGEHNSDFHPMVDFLEASPLRYALTVKPTVYVSHIRQFWSTTRIKTTEEGTKILATVNGIIRSVSESSLRRNLKLRDEDGISSLTDAELFENLTLIGYNISPNHKFTFQKDQFSHQWKYLIHTIVQCLSPKSTGFNKFSSNIATALVCLATNRTYNFSKMIFDGLVKNINNKGEGSGTPTEPDHTPSPEVTLSHPSTSSIPRPSIPTAPIPPVTQTVTPPILQYTRRARIAQKHSELLAKFQAQEVEIIRLKERVKVLEDKDGVIGDKSGDDAPIKGRSNTEGEAPAKRISNDSEEIARVLTSMDATTVLAGEVNVPTGSGFILTAAPTATIVSTGSKVGPTASPIVQRKKGKEIMMDPAMLVHQGKGSGTPTEPHHTPFPEAQTPSHSTHPSSSLPPDTTTSIPTVTPTEPTPIKQYTRRTRIAQSSVPPTIADEPVSPQRDVSQGEACPIDSGFIADQDRVTIDKSSTLPHDSAPWVTSPAVVEGTQEVEINRLKERVKQLEERKGVAATNSGDDAPIKGRSMDEGEAATERVSDDTKEMAIVLTSMDAATVLASRVVDVSTGSGSIPTASTPAEGSVPTGSKEVPTASPIFSTATMVTPVTKRKGKEVMVESETPKKQKVQEQIDAQVSRELEEQLEKEDQRRDEQIARNNLGWKVKDFKGMTFKEVEAKFNSVCKQMEDFIPMGSKEEAERIKRKEVPEEKVKEMMNLVPIEEVYVEALQVKHHIINWKVHSEGQRSYWKITRLGGSSTCYQFFIDLLKHLDMEDLNQLWKLVKETLSTRPPTSDKEMKLWVELSRLYEPDEADQLQRQRNLYACEEGLPSEEGSSTCDDLLQTSSREFLTYGK
nr:synaptobrevin, longin-like domain protein [Tanacetum cinerariifolium]